LSEIIVVVSFPPAFYNGGDDDELPPSRNHSMDFSIFSFCSSVFSLGFF
jgi:hypothetical protein